MNWRKHHIILRSSYLISIRTDISLSMHHNNHMHNKITISRTTIKTSTPHNKHTHKEGVVETSEVKEEEDLVE